MKTTFSFKIIQLVLWSAILFSALAFCYHLRWFISYLVDGIHFVGAANQFPSIWFVVQLTNNIIFLYSAYLIYKLIRNYGHKGFLDHTCMQTFNILIIACLWLAGSGSVLTLSNHLNEFHLDAWTSLYAIANLLFRSTTNLLIFDSPQTMYLLLALILWCVKQFVANALLIKKENESFI